MIAPDDRRFGILWMSRQALEAALGFKDEFNEVSVQLDGTTPAKGVIARIETVLKPYGGIGAYTRDQQTSHAFVSSMLDQLAGVGRIVPLIFLMVAAFLTHTIMGRVIDTERQHIGILKALGISDRAIGWHYLKIALVLTALGIGLGLIVGAALGLGLTEVYTQFFHFPSLHYRQDPVISAAAGLAAAGAMIAGTYRGVRRAASLPPSVAMAPAMPPGYRKVPWEMIHRRLSEPTRMIVRHIARWPFRAALAVVGLSLAVAIQISMLFSFDALDHMIRFYGEAQRQDVTVFFGEPQPNAAVVAATRWPGVLKAEAYRTIPARLTFGDRSRLVNLTGLQSMATLSRLLDEKLTPVRVPSSGIALSSKLAALLQAKVGDVVTVQPVGSHEQLKVPIMQLTEQYIGLDAYMDFVALNALVDDRSLITGIHLQIDEHQRAALYRTLKNAPGIAGVSERAVVLASFHDTMVRTLTIIVSVFVAFAGIAAFGIVYSHARIMLSERAREFATLAALGFSAREVAYILVAELAALVLLALPLGCLLGRGLGWLIAQRLDTDLYRVPLVISPDTLIVAIATVLLAALVSVWMIGRKVRKLNVLSMLNTEQ